MLITQHIRQIVDACHPKTIEEAERLWHDIKPVKFGDRLTWINLATPQILAFYQIPEDAAYLVIMRVECYSFTNTLAAAGFREFEPPPGGTAFWRINTGAGPQDITGRVPIHLLTDVDELTIVRGGLTITLDAILDAPPDANRFIRTLVYAYHVSALIADQIGSGETLTFGRNT